ncbi:MAG: peptidase G2 autoproteolytic cleavage domain-containing protein, partial [Fusobacteriaceae bacterium]
VSSLKATTVDGTLGVTGVSSLKATTVDGTLDVTGNTSLGGTLDVTGNTSLGGTLGVTGHTSVSSLGASGDIIVAGTSTLKDTFVDTLVVNKKSGSSLIVFPSDNSDPGFIKLREVGEVGVDSTYMEFCCSDNPGSPIDGFRFGTGALNNLNDVHLTLTADGNMVGTGTISGFTKIYNAIFNDYAEYFERLENENTEPGDIVSLDILSNNECYRKAQIGDTVIVGVHSDEYAMVIGGDKLDCDPNLIEEEQLKKFIPIGLMGRVRVKVKGSVKKGDKITVSNTPGTGVVSKNTDDHIIGLALEDKFDNGIERIRVLIKN